MKAAVVETFDHPPRYRDFVSPLPLADEVLVLSTASAMSQLTRAQASGKHYSSGKPPLVPGADGVGRLANGQRVYFAFPRAPVGAMAEQVAVKAAYTVALPDDIDDVTAAAIANPAMSSWAALTERTQLRKGESVLINGAAGVSGRLAIQIAKHLGAGRVIATARNPAAEAELRALGADAFVPLPQSPKALGEHFRAEIAEGVDIVLDYLWGPPAEALLSAANGHAEGEAARPIRFINIGALAGASIALPAGVLRSSAVDMMGSGLGSLSNLALMRSIGSLMQVVRSIGLAVNAEPIPLSEVESAWTANASGRVVFTL